MVKLYFRYTIVFFFCLFGLLQTQARTVLYDEESGLSNIIINAIAKDKVGNMWLGTKRGLNTYDGYRFTPIDYFKKRAIICLVFDSVRNVIWIGSDYGLYYINCETYNIIQCSKDSGNAVTNIRMHGSDVYVGYREKYILKISDNFRCKVVYHFAARELRRNRMCFDKMGHLFLNLMGTSHLVKVNLLSPERIERIDFDIPSFDYLQSVQCINNHLIVSFASNGIKELNNNHGEAWYIKDLNETGNDLECLLESRNKLFAAFRNKTEIYEIHKDTNIVTKLTKEDPNIFLNKQVHCLFYDECDILWVGTSKGLIKMTPEPPNPIFEKMLNDSDEFISTRQITMDNNGDMYVCSYSGLFVQEKKNKQWIKYSQIEFAKERIFYTQRSALNVSDRYLYLGSDANTFVRFDKQLKTFESSFIKMKGTGKPLRSAVYSMEMDALGIVWMGTDIGLVSVDTTKQLATSHSKDKFSVDKKIVRYIYMLPGKKQFWAGTESGLFLVDITKGILLRLSENSTPALSDDMINSVTVDSRGNTWIGTDAGGVNVLSPDYKRIYTITTKDGLSNNEVYSLLWQDSNRLWIGTYKGLNYYHTQNQSLVSYYVKDGIAANEFNQNSVYKAVDGKLYMGGVNGITSFYPTQVDMVHKPFTIFLSELSKWDAKSKQYVDKLPASAEDYITVNQGDNQLTLSFASNDFTNPEQNTYLYKINEINDEWLGFGNAHLLQLENLSPGFYTLQVKALNRSKGLVSANILTYHLDFKQVFYQTAWFYALATLGLIFLIWLYFTLRLRNIRNVQLLRIKIASNLHDEVGSLLTRITMSADRLVQRLSRDSETREKLEHVSQLSREANVAMSDVLWTIDARNDVTTSLTDRMREHAEDMLLPRGIELEIDFSKLDQQQKISPEYRQHLFLLFKETINNIIKHSYASHVYIEYTQSGEHYRLVVKNNGSRIPDGHVITGQGLKNIQMRAELLKGIAEIQHKGDVFEVVVYI